MAEINLSTAVRSNLLTLQDTADLLAKTQRNLATGLKVNSALDNPGSFFTAAGLNSRASDLSTLLDDQGQALQTIKTADNAITSITRLVESAKAKANQALQTQSQIERQKLTTQYNELLGQIEDLAKDASYKGKNLLGGAGNDLEVIFNEDNTSKLTISAVDYTDTTLDDGLNLEDLVTGATSSSVFSLQGTTSSLTFAPNTDLNDNLSTRGFAAGDTIAVTDGTTTRTFTYGTTGNTVQDLLNFVNDGPGVDATYDSSTGALTIQSNFADLDIVVTDAASPAPTATAVNGTAVALVGTTKLDILAGFKAGDVLTLEDGNGFRANSLNVTANTTVNDLVAFINATEGASAQITSSNITLSGEVDYELKSDNKRFGITDHSGGTTSYSVDATDSGFATDGDINNSIGALNTALDRLRAQAGEFGTQLTTVEIRQDFTKRLINTLEEGAGQLTLADTNEEGANLLALQTRQQLSSTALSFASQADQAVLQLIR